MQPTPPKPPQAPSTKPLAQPAPKDTTLDTSPKNYYQAIGWLRGNLVQDEEERFYIQIRDVNFPLYFPRRILTVAKNLCGQSIWLKCYPQSKGEGLSFKVVWMGLEQNEQSDPGIFVLRGVWQFIPQCRRPVFSVYRNELKSYENRPNNQHLPLIWSDQPPYRFRKDSEERPKFYQIVARLIPQRNCFGFMSQIADPVEQPPKRVKKTIAKPKDSETEEADKTPKSETAADTGDKLDSSSKSQPVKAQASQSDNKATDETPTPGLVSQEKKSPSPSDS